MYFFVPNFHGFIRLRDYFLTNDFVGSKKKYQSNITDYIYIYI